VTKSRTIIKKPSTDRDNNTITINQKTQGSKPPLQVTIQLPKRKGPQKRLLLATIVPWDWSIGTPRMGNGLDKASLGKQSLDVSSGPGNQSP